MWGAWEEAPVCVVGPLSPGWQSKSDFALFPLLTEWRLWMRSPPASACAGGLTCHSPTACTFRKAPAPKFYYVTSVGNFASLNSSLWLFSSGGASSPSISKVSQEVDGFPWDWGPGSGYSQSIPNLALPPLLLCGSSDRVPVLIRRGEVGGENIRKLLKVIIKQL